MKNSYFLAVGLMLTSMAPAAAQMKVEKSNPVRESVASSLQNSCSERTVLASMKMAKGIEKRVVRDIHGRVFIDIVRNGVVSAGPQSLNLPMRAPANASFFESFEGHQDELDWLPEGWTEINTEANKPTPEMCSHNINNSWSGQDTGDGYWTDITPDGVKEAWIHFTYAWNYTDENGEKVTGGPDMQDEWLITPEINVRPGDNLYFLGECDLGAVYTYNWSYFDYDLDSDPECDLEVLVTKDDGENWDKIWALSTDVCSQMSTKDMYNCMGDLKYRNYSIDLADYEGTNIKIAFRYRNVGNHMSGNSMAVDAVTVAAPQPEAFYQLPYGTLMAGITENLYATSNSYCLMPAWTPVSWTAESNATTERNEWTVYDAATGGSSSHTGNTLTIEYPYSEGNAYPFPLLAAKSADLSDFYSFDGNDEEPGGIYYGGSLPKLEFGDGSPAERILLGNYDYKHKHLICPYLDYGAYCFGTSPANTWGTGIKQTAFGNLFPAPAAPLTLEDVFVTLGECDLDDDAEITLSIYEVDEYGSVEPNPAATASVKGSEISGFGFYQVKFHLQTPYSMKGNTLMMVSGFDSDKVRTFAACAQTLHNDEQHNYAYMMFDFNGQPTLYSASKALEDYSSALYFSLNGAYHFLRTQQEIVDLDIAANEATVSFTASSAPETWWIVDGDNKLPISAEGTEYKWLTVSPAAEGNALTFTAEETASDRAVTVVLANGGDETRVRIRQMGGSGVSVIASTGKGVSLRNDILTVAEAGERRITVYSLDGRVMTAGANGLDISGLNRGVYVVSADGVNYKFVK